MLACHEEECEASLKDECEQVLTPPGLFTSLEKVLALLACTCVGTHTHTAGTEKQKLPGQLQRDASSRAQRAGRGGKPAVSSVVCFQPNLIKNPQTNHPKQTPPAAPLRN